MKNDFSDRLEKKLKKSKTNNNNNNNGYSIGLKISLDLISSILVGTFIGYGLDKIFSTKPIFFIIFLVLGIITGFYSLFKTIKNLVKRRR